MTSTDRTTALVTAVTTGTVLDLDPAAHLEMPEDSYYLHPPGTTLDTLETENSEANEPDEGGEGNQGARQARAEAIAGWDEHNHPTIPAHWIRAILQGHTPPTTPPGAPPAGDGTTSAGRPTTADGAPARPPATNQTPADTPQTSAALEPALLGYTDPHGLQLTGAHLTGRLDLDQLTSSIPLRIHHSHLPHGITAEQAHLPTLTLTGSHLTHPTLPALNADELTTEHGLTLDETIATSHTTHGTIRLLGAHIGGDLDLVGAILTNKTGPALGADRVVVDSDLSARDAEATGAGELGAVRLLNAHIGGDLDLVGAILTNKTGPALAADRVVVDSDLSAWAGVLGAVSLRGARIGGDLDLDGAILTNKTGPALAADGLVVDSDLDARAEFTGAGADGAVRLRGARIGGQLWVDLHQARNTSGDHPTSRWVVDGLTYTGYPNNNPNPKSWLTMLQEGTPRYAAQPYRHLAGIAHAAGHDTDERTILIAQRQDQITRGGLTRRAKLWARFTGLALGYGYKPGRMAVALLIIIAAALAATFLLSAHGATTTFTLTPTTPVVTAHAAATAPCSAAQQAGLALDASMPLVKTVLSGSCTPTPGATGIGLAWTLIGLQLLAWAAATLFIAGYTRIVRRT